jgi:tetratricopeptide (TPR) repeat protein
MKRLRIESPLVAAAVLSLVGFAAYANSLHVPFFFDDPFSIVENPTIRNLSALGKVLSPPNDGSGVTGRPLVNLSLAVNYAIGGLNPAGYHAVNILLHVGAGLALFGLVRRTLLMPSLRDRFGGSAAAVAFLTSAIWLLHPLQTESVTCVIQRTELIVGLFYLLTLYGFVRASETTSPTWPLFAVGACFLGMASKEVMVSAPLIVLLYDRTFLAGSFAEAWRQRRRIYLGLVGSWLLLGYLVAAGGGARGEAAGFGMGVAWWSYALKQCEAIILYLRLTVWPNPLVVFYGIDVITNPVEVWPQILVLVALVSGTVISLWRRPITGFFGMWFFAILAPSSSVVPLVTQTVSEHRMYLPLAAPVALAVAGSFLALGRRALAGLAIIAVALGVVSSRRNGDYRNELAIWTDTVAKAPTNARARNNLGDALQRAGKPLEALAQFQAGLRYEPTSAEAYYNIGAIYLDLGRPADAIAPCEAAIRLKPKFALPYNNLGTALLQTGRLAEGVAQLQTALRLKPDIPEAHSNLARAFNELGDPAKAIEHGRRALQLRPDMALAHFHLANAYLRLNQSDQAIAELQAAVRAQPDYPEAHSNLGSMLYQAGRPAEAIPHYEAALRSRPDYVDAHSNLAGALFQVGRAEESISHYREALRLKPDYAEAHFNLALVLSRLGRSAEAIAEHEAVLRLIPNDARARSELTRLRGK